MNIDLTKLNRIEIINESGRVLTVRQEHLGFTVQDDGRTLKVFMKSDEPCDLECGNRFFQGRMLCRHGRTAKQSLSSIGRRK